MHRIQIDVRTGERRIVELTHQEKDDAIERTAAEAAERVAQKSPGAKAVDQILADPAALAELRKILEASQ